MLAWATSSGGSRPASKPAFLSATTSASANQPASTGSHNTHSGRSLLTYSLEIITKKSKSFDEGADWFDLFLSGVYSNDQFCCVLGICKVGAKCDFEI